MNFLLIFRNQIITLTATLTEMQHLLLYYQAMLHTASPASPRLDWLQQDKLFPADRLRDRLAIPNRLALRTDCKLPGRLDARLGLPTSSTGLLLPTAMMPHGSRLNSLADSEMTSPTTSIQSKPSL